MPSQQWLIINWLASWERKIFHKLITYKWLIIEYVGDSGLNCPQHQGWMKVPTSLECTITLLNNALLLFGLWEYNHRMTQSQIELSTSRGYIPMAYVTNAHRSIMLWPFSNKDATILIGSQNTTHFRQFFDANFSMRIVLVLLAINLILSIVGAMSLNQLLGGVIGEKRRNYVR